MFVDKKKKKLYTMYNRINKNFCDILMSEQENEFYEVLCTT